MAYCSQLKHYLVNLLLACLHDQGGGGFFWGPAFFRPIRAFWKLFRMLWLAG